MSRSNLALAGVLAIAVFLLGAAVVFAQGGHTPLGGRMMPAPATSAPGNGNSGAGMMGNANWDQMRDAMNNGNWDQMRNAMGGANWDQMQQAMGSANWDQMHQACVNSLNGQQGQGNQGTGATPGATPTQ